MIVEFSVENFLSFKERVTLSFEASWDKECPNNVIRSAQGTDLNLLKSVILYGANASGKSNLFAAIGFMDYLVLKSAKENTAEDVTRRAAFKLDKECITKPSTFEIVFLSEGVRYQYGFSLNNEKILEEWLFSYPLNRRRVLFTRGSELNDPSKDYYFGDKWKGEALRLAKMTRKNSLFVSVATQFNHPITEIVNNWFKFKLAGVLDLPFGEPEEDYTKLRCMDDNEVKEGVLALIQNADFAIKDIKINTIKHISSEKLNGELSENTSEHKEILEVSFLHSGIDKEGKPFDVVFNSNEESDGTKKYFALAGPILHVIKNGCCMLADELDVKLHPLLTKGIIEIFHDPNTNKSGAQLLCAIHDINLLSHKELIRRDQIWFTARTDIGSTELYSAWDYRIRKGESLDKGYLAGRYGAVPFIEKLL